MLWVLYAQCPVQWDYESGSLLHHLCFCFLGRAKTNRINIMTLKCNINITIGLLPGIVSVEDTGHFTIEYRLIIIKLLSLLYSSFFCSFVLYLEGVIF